MALLGRFNFAIGQRSYVHPGALDEDAARDGGLSPIIGVDERNRTAVARELETRV